MTKLPTDLSGRDLVRALQRIGSLSRGSAEVISSYEESLPSRVCPYRTIKFCEVAHYALFFTKPNSVLKNCWKSCELGLPWGESHLDNINYM
jgi:hypothetical protein